MKKMFIRLAIICVFSLVLAPGLIAQDYDQKDKGLVTYKLGTDTTTMQYFEFDNRKFHTVIVFFTGFVTKYEADGELDEKGDIKKVISKIYNLDTLGNWRFTNESTNSYIRDSTIYSIMRDGKEIVHRAIASKAIVSNAADAASFFVFPYMGFFAPAKIGDTVMHCQLSFNECRKFEVIRKDKDELKVGSNVMGRLKLFVDKKGRMESGDAVGSSLNWTATVDRGKKDWVAFLDENARRRLLTKSLSPRTLRDTARIVMNGKKIEIDYWRPLRRNRQIFGAVVPWGRVWRVGSNNATQLRTGADIVFDSTGLIMGKYSMWVIPEEKSWLLIFNRKADVWGTEYDSTANQTMIRMNVEKVSEPVEIHTITLKKLNETQARLQIEWEYYKAWVDFKIN